MAVGTNLRKLRSKTKYSQQDIADLLEIDRVTYTNWENETTDVKSQYIPKLAEIFDVEIEELFENDPRLQINNFENLDNSIGQHGIIINVSDKETAKLLSEQIKELVRNLKK